MPSNVPFHNQLLDILPSAERGRLEPHLQRVKHKVNDVLYQARSSIDFCYFPTTGVASVLAIMADGSAIEVATVGKEGLVGHTVALGATMSVNRVIVQVPGDFLRMSASALEAIVAESTVTNGVLAKYSVAYLFQTSQSAACNGLHQLEKRCCRWLLLTRDRVESNELSLTHEFLGLMLGVRRASVSEVLAPLQESGLLRSHRGVITLLDPEGVEERSCECYRLVKEEYDRLLTL